MGCTRKISMVSIAKRRLCCVVVSQSEKPRPLLLRCVWISISLRTRQNDPVRANLLARKTTAHLCELCSRYYSHKKCHLFQSSTPPDWSLSTSSLIALGMYLVFVVVDTVVNDSSRSVNRQTQDGRKFRIRKSSTTCGSEKDLFCEQRVLCD